LPNMRLLLLKDTPLIFLAVVVGRLHKLNFIACRERTWFVTLWFDGSLYLRQYYM